MRKKYKVVSVYSIAHGVAEVIINGETHGYICKQDNQELPVVLKLSRNYQLGEFDCNMCALRALVELESRVSVLNEQYQSDYAARAPYLATMAGVDVSVESMINRLSGEAIIH